MARGAAVSVPANGDFGLAGPLEGALRKGDAVRLRPAGVAVREGGLLGRLIVGLSQDEKKSSSLPAGVLVPLPESSTISVIVTSPGYLNYQYQNGPRT